MGVTREGSAPFHSAPYIRFAGIKAAAAYLASLGAPRQLRPLGRL